MFAFGSDREAFVSPRFAFYKHLTVYKNLVGDLLLRGFAQEKIQNRIAEMEDYPWLSPILYRTAGELSPMELYLAALARALVAQPSALALELPPGLSQEDPAIKPALSHIASNLGLPCRLVPPESGTAWTGHDSFLTNKQGQIS